MKKIHKIEGKILTSIFRHVNGEDTAGEANFYYMYKNTDVDGDFESQEHISFPIHYSLVENLSKEECFDGKKIIISVEIK